MDNLVTPTLHLNGSSGGALLEQWLAVRAALMGAMDALHEAHPNARDYYVQSPRAITEAVAQHGVRMRRIDETIREADAIIESIQSQLDARNGA